ncbi:efflux RND transporter periplasmic adaptor subunit [Dyella telluris]|uniref:Efflux RND transporter periplasmic adaptor subunit n=1 Tax=Dyella telluris TaxID=2763498 RepID=A0A7G8Q3G4_9GAMM|nr:efflux RND transporter periplasmic adaptor subunit [Dyella telluris]QNK01322.1 efflux RND transporter periplasmic adaptor subunit [Dyella telluris]
MSSKAESLDAPGASTPTSPRRRWLLRTLALTLMIGAISVVVWYLMFGRWSEGTDDAYVGGNVVQITSQVSGTVMLIGADDGDLVHKGDILVRLDKSELDVALDRAKADLASTVRRVRGLYTSASGAASEVALSNVALDRAKKDYERRRDLARSGAISSEELAHALDGLLSAQSAQTNAAQRYNTSQVLVDDTVVSSHPDVLASVARLRAAYLDDVRTDILAPVTGYVAKRSVQLGQRAQPGYALMAVVPLREVWVDANFKETQLLHMRIGQPVAVEADVYGGDVRYKAVIESLGVGTGSAFSLLPAQNATGNWIKIVQRIPVRLRFTEPAELDAHPLRIGMSTVVDVNLHDQSGPLLPPQSPKLPILATDVYAHQLADAQALIDRIVHANNPTAFATAGKR